LKYIYYFEILLYVVTSYPVEIKKKIKHKNMETKMKTNIAIFTTVLISFATVYSVIITSVTVLLTTVA